MQKYIQSDSLAVGQNDSEAVRHLDSETVRQLDSMQFVGAHLGVMN